MFNLSIANITLLGLLFALFETVGIIVAIHAVLNTRTSQGAIAWAFFLVTMPYIALPLYALLGRHKLTRAVESRRDDNSQIHQSTVELQSGLERYQKKLQQRKTFGSAMEKLSEKTFTGSNSLKLLDTGRATFDAIFSAIEQAQSYILLELYIVNDDEVGQELKERLIDRQGDGVQVYFLYDSIGSYRLSRQYCDELSDAGIKLHEFGSMHLFRNRFQLNFRNHRKIFIVDGKVGFTGGYNVSNEYLGKTDKYGCWRDTHIRISGPAVLGLQAAFVEDWYWVTGDALELSWSPEVSNDDALAMVIPTGPADNKYTCSLFFMHMLNSAQQRAWITSPYFVPNEAVMESLKLAAVRDVDVRVMIPGVPDKRTVWYAAFAYIREAQEAGVKFYRYQKGFLHQKVMLVDHDLSVVGTANLDNRSFRLNFELSILVPDTNFAAQVEEMLLKDFSDCQLITEKDATEHAFIVRIAIAVARLFSPIL